MNLFQKLKHFFLVIALFEIITFILVAYFIGVFATILLIMSTSIIGYIILKKHQQRAFNGKGMSLNFASTNPVTTIGALLLLVPGFLTDILGVILLIPFFRKTLTKPFSKYFVQKKNKGDIIEGECWKEDSKKD